MLHVYQLNIAIGRDDCYKQSSLTLLLPINHHLLWQVLIPNDDPRDQLVTLYGLSDAAEGTEESTCQKKELCRHHGVDANFTLMQGQSRTPTIVGFVQIQRIRKD